MGGPEVCACLRSSSRPRPMPAYVRRPATSGAAMIVAAGGLRPHRPHPRRHRPRRGRRLPGCRPGALPPLRVTGRPVRGQGRGDGPAAELTDAGLTADVEASLDFLAGEGIPPARVAIVGFCMGGSVVVMRWQYVMGARIPCWPRSRSGGGRQGRFGMPSMLDLAPTLRTPWLGLYGDLDLGIPVDQVAELGEAVAHAPVTAEVVRYPTGKHGFHCDDRPDVFDPDSPPTAGRAPSRSWRRASADRSFVTPAVMQRSGAWAWARRRALAFGFRRSVHNRADARRRCGSIPGRRAPSHNDARLVTRSGLSLWRDSREAGRGPHRRGAVHR